MANTLKEGKEFKDPYNGLISTAYQNIKDVGFNLNNEHLRFTPETYRTETSRQEGKKPIADTTIVVDKDYFNLHIKPILITLIQALYIYQLQIEKLDENGDSYDPIQYEWGDDWESDEA